MPRPPANQPTELELELLKILWDGAPRKVSDIREELSRRGRDIAHTSVITTLNIMVEKKYLKRSKQGNALWFSPKVEREGMSRDMLGSMVDRLFSGSPKAVLLSLLDCKDIDADELKELRKIINQKMKEENS